jgi:4-hydroxythreonine-4-phosphate dehydrogenase
VTRGRVPLAVTMGDPAGIGAEVVLRAIRVPALARCITPILVGDPGVWHDTARRLQLPLRLPEGDAAPTGGIRLVATSGLPERWRRPGPVRGSAAQAACGAAAYAAIVEAVRLVQSGTAAGLVTAPISKAHVAAAGHHMPGHTELLAKLCGDVPVRMMMAGPTLRVVLVTTHLALRDVPRRLTRELVLQTIAIAAEALRRRFGFAHPRLAVAGLNPHAGEEGLFGDDEARVIAPAVRAARRRGIAAVGPLAADGLFPQLAAGAYDAAICMYHDQGLAPFKLLHFADGVNVTLGLPFVRTSPDHGTAFDIAGTGRADPRSMVAAIRLAAEGAQHAAGRKP